MSLDRLATGYVAALRGEANLEGGIAYQHAMDVDRLDFSAESLHYVDEFLDVINDSGLATDDFLDKQENQNLLYALAFYVGEVVSRVSGSIRWFSYADKRDQFSKLEIEECFGTSIGYQSQDMLQFPLSSIMTRLFEGPHEKSVYYSALGSTSK